MIKLGDIDVDIKIGSADAKIYLGDTMIQSGDTPTPPTPSSGYIVGDVLMYDLDEGLVASEGGFTTGNTYYQGGAMPIAVCAIAASETPDNTPRWIGFFSQSCSWDFNIENSCIGNYDPDAYSGKAYTTAIVNSPQYDPSMFQAAASVTEFHTDGTRAGDWYLPAAPELSKLYDNRTTIDAVLAVLGERAITADTYHWSSTETAYIDGNNTYCYAIYLNFNTGELLPLGAKHYQDACRPMIMWNGERTLHPICSELIGGFLFNGIDDVNAFRNWLDSNPIEINENDPCEEFGTDVIVGGDINIDGDTGSIIFENDKGYDSAYLTAGAVDTLEQLQQEFPDVTIYPLGLLSCDQPIGGIIFTGIDDENNFRDWFNQTHHWINFSDYSCADYAIGGINSEYINVDGNTCVVRTSDFLGMDCAYLTDSDGVGRLEELQQDFPDVKVYALACV